jgi:hypothetical protein
VRTVDVARPDSLTMGETRKTDDREVAFVQQ